MYQYAATVRKVVDGDTLHLAIDLGLDIYTNVTVRLYGINCPEMRTPEGVAAREFTGEWLKGHPQVLIATYKDRREKYGRYLAEIFDLNRIDSLNELLISAGHAVRYDGHNK